MKIAIPSMRAVILDINAPMDPDAMFARMRLAVQTCQILEAKREAERLRSWLLHEGPTPFGMHPVHALIRCRDVLDWVDLMLHGSDPAPAGSVEDCER